MKWPARFPPWLRVMMIALGLLTLLSGIPPALHQSSDSLEKALASGLVGGVWLLLGLAGGLPRVGSAEDLDLQTRVHRISRRVTIYYLTILPFMILTGLVLAAIPREKQGVAFLAIASLYAAYTAWTFLAQCPRCGNHFFLPHKLFGRISLSRCQHCGLDEESACR